jgi:hypothetical protein
MNLCHPLKVSFVVRDPDRIPAPGLPFSINFLVEPGMEHLALRATRAYQAVSKRRVPPPMFPALAGEP